MAKSRAGPSSRTRTIEGIAVCGLRAAGHALHPLTAGADERRGLLGRAVDDEAEGGQLKTPAARLCQRRRLSGP
jgi:hypothetical protein